MKNVKILQSRLNIFYIFVGSKRNRFFNLFIDQIRGCFDQHGIKIAQLKRILFIGYVCYRRKSFVIKSLTNLNLFTKNVTTLIHQDNKNFTTLIHQD